MAAHPAHERTFSPAHELLDPQLTYGAAADQVLRFPLARKAGRWWWTAVGVTSLITGGFALALFWVLYWGVGVWGINIPIAWGFAIINFVWWIGIGHAGTLISAILLLCRQPWRTSINRFAEAMTLFAVMMAGLFPLLHLGRIWKFYYILPYPNTFALWPQWRSALCWDVVAVMTYFTVSVLFWYLGLLPDLAKLRDHAQSRLVRRLAGIGALGWRGAARHWQHHQVAYLILAGLATPLVVSVHSIVSLDFAIAQLPGWQSPIFPPYFVAGAIFSGFSMVLCLVIPARPLLGLKQVITPSHLDVMGKVMLVAGLVVGYGYLMEYFTEFFSDDKFEIYLAKNRLLGPYGVWFWATLGCNVAAPQFLWIKAIRRNPWTLFLVAMAINVGMWLERYVIVIVSLHRDFLPSSWDMYQATIWDWMLFIGTIGVFLGLMLLFIRALPSVAISEVQEQLHEHDGPGVRSDVARAKAASDPPVVLASDKAVYGVVGAFATPEDCVEAAQRARSNGYVKLEAYTPFPVKELPAALGYRKSRLPLVFLLAGFGGAAFMFWLQSFAATVHYPWNVGGRPYFSWPSFIPLTFEFGVLSASVCGFLAVMVAARFPRPYHPLFNLAGFERASRDRFMLCIEAGDPKFDRRIAREFMASLHPVSVAEVPAAPPREATP